MSKDQTGGCLAAIVFILVGIPLSMALYGEAAVLNWNWYAVPLGAPHLTFWPAYGLSLAIQSFNPNTSKSTLFEDDKDPASVVVKFFGYVILRFAALAGVGWAVHSWLT